MKRLSMTGDEKSGGAISSLSTSEAPAPESTPTPAPQTSSTQQDFLHEEISEETPILDRQQKPPDKQIRITRTSSDEATKKNTRLSPPTEDPLSAPKEDCRLTEDESFEQRPRSTGGIVRKNSIWVRAAKSKKQGPFQKARPPDQSMGSFIIEKLSNFVTMLREIERPEDLKLRLVVGFLFCVIFCGLFATYYHYYRKTVEKKVGDILRFRYIQREVLVVSETREEPLLKGLLGVNFPDDVGNPFPCLRRATLDSRDFCLEWRKRARVHVTAFNSSSKFQCVSIAWDSLTVPIGALEDCFALGGAQWFSPGASIMWNTNQQMSQAVPYLNGIFASFVKRDWITSTGLQITVPPTVSLHVSVNKLPGHVCFRSDYNLRYIRGLESESTLKYSICHTRRPFEATLGRNRELFRLRKLPELRRKKEKAGPYLFFRPIDSHYPFSQEGVINMTQEFLGNGRNLTWLILDQVWQNKIGDFTFDLLKFPDPKGMFSTLNSLGVNLALEISPFISVGAKTFMMGLREGFLVPGSMARTPALTQFRGQQGMALLDGTNPVARTWLNRKLRALTKKYNITNFVLDAGSAKNVPPGAKFRNGLENPDQHVIDLAQALTNGTNLLAVYPPIENSTACALILQDSTKPDVARRLLRRVLELNSFNYTCYLPALSYSFYELIKDPALSHRYQQLTKFLAFRPWIYNEDTLTPVTSPMGDKRFRKEIRFARILPMWVISSSKDAYKIDDQFVLGPSLFIAPILDSTNTRRIFVPEGRWKDSSNMVHNGPKWIEEYWAGWEVPFFIRVEKRERTKYGW